VRHRLQYLANYDSLTGLQARLVSFALAHVARDRREEADGPVGSPVGYDHLRAPGARAGPPRCSS
jgi:hypothetical protein